MTSQGHFFKMKMRIAFTIIFPNIKGGINEIQKYKKSNRIYLITLIIMFLNFNEIIKLNRLIEGSLIFLNIILCIIYSNVLNKN